MEVEKITNFTVLDSESWGDHNPILGTLEVVAVDTSLGTITVAASHCDCDQAECWACFPDPEDHE